MGSLRHPFVAPVVVITSLLLVVVASPGSSGLARAQTGLEVGLKLVGQLGGGSPSVAVAGGVGS